MITTLRQMSRSQAIVITVWLAAVSSTLLFVPYECSITFSDWRGRYNFGTTVHYRFILSDPPPHSAVPLDEKRWGTSHEATEAPIGISLTRLLLELTAVTLACFAAYFYITFVGNGRSSAQAKPAHSGAAGGRNASASANDLRGVSDHD